MSHEIDRILETARGLMAAGKRGVLVTLLRTSGSTYRRAGARAVIGEDGLACGLVSGGCIERDLAVQMERWFAHGSAQVVTYDSTSDADVIFGSGVGCRGTLELLVEPFDARTPPQLDAFVWNGREPVVWTTRLGERELLVEVIRPPRSVAVFGSGPDVPPLVRMCQCLGWDATPFAASERVIPCAGLDAAVVMTHNFLHDVELLDILLPSPVPYVGVLGPRRRREELLMHCSDPARVHASRLRGPIGLHLGGDTPEEIALSIVAEVQAVLEGGEGRALQERDAPIHEPEHVRL